MARTIEAKLVVSGQDNTGGVFEKMAAKFKDIASAAKSLEKVRPAMAWGDSFQRQLDGLKLTQRELANVRKGWEQLQASMRSAPNFKTSTFFSGLDAFKSKTLSDLRAVRGAYEQTAAAQHKMMSGMRAGARFGAGALGIGGGAYVAQRGLRAGVAATSVLERETARGYLAGMTPAEVEAAQGRALELSTKYKTVDRATAFQHIRLLRGRFGDFHHAMERADDVVAAQQVLGTLKGGEHAGEDLEKLVLGLESLGTGADPEKFRRYMSSFVKAKALFPDLRGEDFRQYMMTAKSGKYGLSEEYLAGVAPTMMQHEGAMQFGTQQASAFSALVGGRQTKKAWAKAAEYGLVDKEKGGIREERLFISNPYEWAKQILEPALSAKGITAEKDKEGMVSAINKMFSARNVGEFFTSMLVNKSVIEKDKGMLAGAKGLEAAGEVMERDPFAATHGIFAQLRTLISTLASPLVGPATERMNAISDSIAHWSKTLAANPEVAKEIGATAVGVGGALGIAGTTLLGKHYIPKLFPGAAGPASLAPEIATAARFAAAATPIAAGAIGNALRFLGPAGNAAAGVGAMYDATRQYEGMNLGERLRAKRGGRSMGETLRDDFNVERDRQGVPRLGEQLQNLKATVEGPITATLEGKAEIHNTVTVKIEAPELIRAYEKAREITSNATGHVGVHNDGPGSTGKSMPEAMPAPPPLP